jgi:glycosyltransferase involved in cell wall biosynthesis
MRILMIHPHDIHSSAEPWTRRIKSLAIELVKNNYEVKLAYFPLSYNGNAKSHFLDGYEAIPFNRYPSPIAFLKNTLKFINLGRWADIIHFQKCHHYAVVPVLVSAYLNRKPLHYDWDDWEEMIWYESCGRGLHSKFIGFSFKTLERFLPILSDSVSVSSEYLKKLALSFGVKREGISYIPVGANLKQFNPDIDGSRIRQVYKITGSLVLYIGQLHGAQYIDLFIKAANVVLHKYPHVSFMIVGEGFMENSLRILVKELGIDDKVIFTGSVSHQEIPEYIAAADVCVAPFRDTKVARCKSPLKIVEYLASGKAIVASNVGEVRRMLGGVGILVEPGKSLSLAEGILRLLGERHLRDNLGRFARQRAEEKYNWEVSARNLMEAYRGLTLKG